jgi:hypothetical protein
MNRRLYIGQIVMKPINITRGKSEVSSFSRSKLWGTMSKALLNSKYTESLYPCIHKGGTIVLR